MSKEMYGMPGNSENKHISKLSNLIVILTK